MKIKLCDYIIDLGDVGKYTKDMCVDYVVDDALSSDFCIGVEPIALKKEKELYPDAPEDYLENICLYRSICQKLVAHNSLLIHSAALSVDGECYLFSATRGTGKTTHMNLWINKFKDRCMVINGDKPIVREINGKFMVYGTPWCGKEGINNNTCAPLKSICIIKRSETNHIERANSHEALSHILSQTVQPEKKDMFKFLDILDRLIKTTPTYNLYCNMEPQAADVCYEGMNNLQ